MEENKLSIKSVSELITIDEIKKWKSGNNITIKAGTGVGKSYFIKNVLYAFAKKNNKRILMLIHRKNCVDQFINEVVKDNKADVIDIKTYQKLEYKELHKYENDLNEYQYIVCDEFHYFISDAAYNKTSDMSLNLILSQSSAIKIFMSATGDSMKRYINNIKKLDTIDYEIPINFNFIEELTFFNKDDTMEMFIEECINSGKNQKAIFFIQSATKAYELFKKYKKYCLFNCGKSDKHYKYVDTEKITAMLENEYFEELILITTTCMDAGVNIKDSNLKHIICEVEDIGTLIQCIGRKRLLNDNDKICLYIKTISNKSLGGKETQLKNKIKMADFLRENTVQEFILKFPRQNDLSNIVYDEAISDIDKGTKKINELMYFKCGLDICDIEIIKFYGEYGYCKYLKYLFGIDEYRIIEEDFRNNEIRLHLEAIKGKKLFKEDRETLIDKIGLKDARGRLQKDIKLLNSYLEVNKLLFEIKSIKDNRRKLEDGSENPYRGKFYWIINKLEV